MRLCPFYADSDIFEISSKHGHSWLFVATPNFNDIECQMAVASGQKWSSVVTCGQMWLGFELFLIKI